jgi:vacuolar-type H+-ATPase subunit I/STV1
MSKQEPKAHVIDGVTYVEVERRAKVGEKIIIVDGVLAQGEYECGSILHVTDVREIAVSAQGVKVGIWEEEYKVLEPLEESPDITDLIANLARRVASLEQQLSATQGNLEKLAEELAEVKHQTQPQLVEAVTFEKFLDSVTEDVAKKLAEKVASDLRTEMRLKALRGF